MSELSAFRIIKLEYLSFATTNKNIVEKSLRTYTIFRIYMTKQQQQKQQTHFLNHCSM